MESPKNQKIYLQLFLQAKMAMIAKGILNREALLRYFPYQL
jgi:hypothetical protein